MITERRYTYFLRRMVAEEEEENRVEVSKFYFTIDGCSNFIDTDQIGT